MWPGEVAVEVHEEEPVAQVAGLAQRAMPRRKAPSTALCGEAVSSACGVRGTGKVLGDSGSAPDSPEPCEVGRQVSPIWCIAKSTHTPCNWPPTGAVDPAEHCMGQNAGRNRAGRALCK